MILDSSVVVAVFLNEPDAEQILETMVTAPFLGISSATFVEAGIVLSHRKKKPMQHALELFFGKLGVKILDFTDDHRTLALRAWWQFGRTRSKANLNFGDCISYATAKLAGQPLFCKGADFPLTDIELVEL